MRRVAQDTGSIERIGAQDPTRVACGSTLDSFVAQTAGGPGVLLRELQPLTTLVVQTRNTRYHIIVTRGDEIVVQGGSFFPEPTPARLDGASLGSSFLKLGWIGVGLRMEIRAGGQRIVTTTVHSVAREDDVPSTRPH
jgi:hypothetical protein